MFHGRHIGAGTRASEGEDESAIASHDFCSCMPVSSDPRPGVGQESRSLSGTGRHCCRSFVTAVRRLAHHDSRASKMPFETVNEQACDPIACSSNAAGSFCIHCILAGA